MLNHKLSLLIAAGLAVSLSAFPALAEDAPPAGDAPPTKQERGPRQSMFERLEAQLKLTDEQKTVIHPIFVDAEAKLNDIRRNRELSPEDKKAQRLEVIEALPDKVNPSLDETQKATFAKFIERMKNPPERGRRGNWGNRGGRDRGDRQKPQ